MHNFAMLNLYELSIGVRYLRSKRRTGFVSFISSVSFLGIALGVLTLITVLSVMNGFEKELRERILGMTAHMTLSQGKGELTEWETLREDVLKHPDIVGAAPNILKQGMLSVKGETTGAMVRGIMPELESQVGDTHKMMVEGSMDDLQAKGFGMVIGVELANQLDVGVGDKVMLLTPQTTFSLAGVFPRMKKFTIVGVFEAGMHEYDSGMAFIHMNDAQMLYQMKGAVSGLQLRLHDLFKVFEVNQSIGLYLPEGPFYAVNWTQQHANFFRAIQMEKRMMFIVLALIIAVAAFNIVSSMMMAVNDKRSDIAVLRTQGAQAKSIMLIFMIQGFVIGALGVLIGGAAGVAVALNIDVIVPFIEGLFGVQFFPGDVYYITQIPSDLKWNDVFKVTGLAFVLTIFATWYPAWKASKIAPAEALRYE